MAAHSVWLFVGLVALAAFCNDLTMGAAWASCLDIGRKYSGIVAGCMNTVGNLGGAVAGWLTGKILEAYTLPAKTEAVLSTSLVNLSSSVTAAGGGGSLFAGLDYGAAEMVRQ